MVLGALPAGLPAAFLVVQHLDRKHPSMMAAILGRRTKLEVRQAAEGDFARAGCVHIAPPDHHLLVRRDGLLTLSQAELVHFVRPSADLLFESVAATFRKRAIAVVLSGTGKDGAMGVVAIKKTGGKVILQEGASAEHGGMPLAALATGSADHVLPLKDIAAAIVKLLG